MDKPLIKSAIVGSGSIAAVHAPLIGATGQTTLVACADIILERAQRLANTYQARAYDSLEAMLDHEDIDVLHICTPHALHVPMAQQAHRKGIRVFMEKPPVTTRQQWQELTQLDATLGVCFQNRYNRNYRHLQQVVQSGVAGKVLGARAYVAWYRDEDYYSKSGWRGTWALEGGGALINQSIHTLDLLVNLLGPHTSVDTGMGNRHLRGVIEVEDTVDARIAFGDAVVIFYATNAAACGSPVQIYVDCEKGTFSLEDNRFRATWRNGRTEDITFEQADALGKDYWGSGHAACINDYYNAVKNNQPAPIGIEAVKNTVSLLLDMYDQGKRTLAQA
jgi:UDP-N-acetyl-2-amino-2-deoxyglucuronate dehydrogenase